LYLPSIMSFSIFIASCFGISVKNPSLPKFIPTIGF